jgi:D-galactarolactone cycloisomerase
VLAIQSGEPGPVAQCVAGIDIAIWDLRARRAGKPLWLYLGGATSEISVYASGINPEHPETMAEMKQSEGYRAFKLKVGFGEERDLSNLTAMRAAVGQSSKLMVDANQAWSVETAIRMARCMDQYDLKWIEEPLRADRPFIEWDHLARSSSIPLAAGENFATEAAFEAAIAARALCVIQPDLAKWGGISGCLPIARKIIASGLEYCPHFLGGGVGLLASAHVLAAAGGDGMLEIDSNPNPLRTLTCRPLNTIREGRATLSELPGIGVEPDLNELRAFAVRV